MQVTAAGENQILTLRDTQQQVEVKVTLSPENLNQLKANILTL